VPKEKKVELVGEVFHRVADKYDLMNDVMSAGVHRWWKDEFVRMLSPPPGSQLLDVAGGTGDIAQRLLRVMRSGPPGPHTATSHVTVADINGSMLAVGRERIPDKGISWLEANAEKLPVPSDSFDAYTIAFGIRNCTNIDKVLAEAYRVLRPGGRFMCLEFSHVTSPPVSALYSFYSFNVIPLVGQLVANDRDSYQYLVESIKQFPNQDKFKAMIAQAGFKHVTYKNLSFGVVAIHSGFKL
jgi:ubiquinone/menaquinone biosynthesis methyltransferase